MNTPLFDRRSFVIGTGSAVLASSTLAWGQAEDQVVRETTTGRIRGLRQSDSLIFLGVPYGAPTGGANRFLPPQPPRPWAGIRDCRTFGERAPQLAPSIKPIAKMLAASEPVETQGEDCLVLNVYTPAIGGTRRPVMVWLHGGGFASGSGGPAYDGRWLAAKHDVVVITLNHRLNLFGFLDLSELNPRYTQSGNVGMLDIVAALEWVRANVERFGGDPNCVTIFGQSGGGAKVSVMLAMPKGRGLFHRAIPQSGAVLRSCSKAQSHELTHALLAQLGLAKHDIDQLQAAPAQTLIDAMAAIGSTGDPASTRMNFGPVVDGVDLPREPFDPDAPAISADVPIMVGSTHDETRLFYALNPAFNSISAEQAQARLAVPLRCSLAEAVRYYNAYSAKTPQLSPAELFLEITREFMFTRNSVETAARKAHQGRAPAYLYRFDWIAPGPMAPTIKASHGMEIPLVFDMEGPTRFMPDSPERRRMAAILSGAWAQFARTGDPNRPGSPHWPAYQTQDRSTMIFDRVSRVENDPDPLRALSATLPDFHP